MKQVLLAAAAAALLMTGCGAGSNRPHASPFLFADPRAPLHIVAGSLATDRPGIRVRDVSFAGRRGRVYGYLALPASANGRLKSVVLLHGAGGDRRYFLPYARRLAGRGFAALTLTAPSGSAPAAAAGLGPRAQLLRLQELAAEDVVSVRRAVDFLDTITSVDPRRIGLVGWSAGARTGALVAGVEPRIRVFVLMSGGAAPVSEYARVAPAALRSDIRRILGRVDPLRWIAQARPGSIFLQDGLHDEFVPSAALKALARAAPPRTRVRWYDAGHRLNAEAFNDQLTWLERRLAGGP
jgi:dienelactone hydrolase